MTFHLEEWPWPFTTQNVQLHEIHMYAKYQVAIFNIAKVMANVKVLGRRRRRTKDGARTTWLWQYLGFSSAKLINKTKSKDLGETTINLVFKRYNTQFDCCLIEQY